MGDSMSAININNEHPASHDTSHANFGAKLIAQTINAVHINNPPCPLDDHGRLSRPLEEDTKQSYHQFGKHLWTTFLGAKWKKSLIITISLIALSTVIIFPILKSKNILAYQKTHPPTSTLQPPIFQNATDLQAPAGTLWHYNGCWEDHFWDGEDASSPKTRTLGGEGIAWDNMTLEICAEECKEFRYFGVEFYTQCFCGNEINPQANLSANANCNLQCNGNAVEVCGGAWNMSIWQKT